MSHTTLQVHIAAFLHSRLSTILRKQEWGHLKLTQNLNERKKVSLFLKEHLKVLSKGHPETSQRCGYHQSKPEGCRQTEQLVHSLKPGKEASGPDYSEML